MLTAFPPRARPLLLLPAVLAGAVLPPAASAQTTWIGTSGNWTTGANWSSGSPPAKSSVFNDIVFNASGVSSNLDESWTVRNVTLNAGTGAGLTVSQTGGSTLSFFEFTANATATVSANLHLLNQAFDTARTFNVASGRTLTLSGIISGDGGGQAFFEKTGAGSVVLSGGAANTFAGELRILAGTVRLEKSSGNAVVTNTVVNSGGTLRLGAGDQISDSHAVTINSGGTFDLAGFTDTIGVLTLASGGTLTDSAGGAVLGITATPVLAAGSDFSFRLRFDAAGIDFALADGTATDDLTLSGVLSGTHGFTKSGAGLLKLSGSDANTFTGTATVSAGTLLLAKSDGSAADNFGAAIGGDLVVNSGATVRLGANDQHNDTKLLHVAGGTFDLNGFTEGVGTGGLQFTGGTLSGSGTFNLFGPLSTVASASTATVASTVDLGSASRTLTVADGTAATDLSITGAISGTGGLVKEGAGTLALEGTAANTFTGFTVVNAGNLLLAKPAGGPANNYGGALRGPLVVKGTVTLGANDQHDDTQALIIEGGTLALNGFSEGTGSGGLQFTGGTISGSGTLNLGSTLTTLASASSATISSNLSLLGGSRTFDIADGAAANDLVVSGVVSDGALVKSGSGRVALMGANTFAAGLSVTAGSVAFNASAALGTGTVSLSGGTLAPSVALTHAAPFTVSGASGLDAGTVHSLFSGVISGTGSITQTGTTGRLTLSAHNTFQGGYTVRGGTAVIGHDHAFGSGQLTLAGGSLSIDAARDFGGSIAVTAASGLDSGSLAFDLSGVISGSGALTKTGSGTLSLHGALANTHTGPFTVAAGTVVLGKPAGGPANNYGSALRGDLVVDSGATVRLAASDQHDDTMLLHVNGGTFDLDGFSEGTTGELRFTGGTLSGGTFNLLGTLATTASSATANVPANLNLFAGSRAVTVADGSASTDLSLSGATTNGTVAKSGAGLLSLSGTTDNAGLVGSVSAGTLVLEKTSTATVHALGGGTHSVAAGATLELGGTGGNQIHDSATLQLDGTFNLNGRNETISRLTGTGLARSTNAAATLSVGSGDSSSTFSGTLPDGNLALDKIGTGTLTLAGTGDNFTRATTVSAGTLVLAKTSSGSVSALGPSVHTVASGATLRLGGTGGNQIHDSARLTVDGTLDLDGRSETIGALSGSGTVTAFSATHGLTLGGGNSDGAFNGTLTAAANALALVKIGTGTQVLGGTSDNAGLTVAVQSGTLELAKTSSATVHALGAGTHTVAAGATLRLGGTGGDQIFDQATVALAPGSTFDLGGRTEAIATFTGTGAIISTGAAGTLLLGADGRSETLSGAITATNAALGKTGAGTLTLAGTTDNDNLAVAVAAGTLVLAKTSSATVHAAGGGTHTVAAGATLRLGGTGGDQIFDGGSLVLHGILDLDGRSETFGGLSGSGTVTPFSAAHGLTVGGNDTGGAFTGTLTASADALALVKIGSGTQSLGGAADNSALRATVSGGTLELAKTSSATVHALGAGTHTVAVGATLRLAGSGGDQIFDDSTLDLAGTLDLNGRSETLRTLAGTGTVTTTGGAGTLTLGALGASGTVDATFATAGVTLGKIGAGTLTLAGAGDNAFLGISVQAGTLVLAKAGGTAVHAVGGNATVAAGATLKLGGTGGDQIVDSALVTVDGTFDLAGKFETVGGLAGTGSVANTGAAAVLGVGGGNASAAFTGTFGSAAVALTKIGLGTQTLGGTGDNAGLVATVTGGTLELAKSSSATVHALGGGTHAVASGATLSLAGTGGDQIADAGTLTLAGTLDLNARSETISVLDGTGAVVSTGGAGTLTVGAGDVSSTLSRGLGAEGVTLGKTGTGTLTLAGPADNSFLGVSVQAGTLVFAKESSASVHAIGSDSTVATGATLRLGGTGGDQIFNPASLVVNGTFDLAGRSETLAGLSGAGVVHSTAPGGHLTVGFNNVSSFLAGTLVDGPGTLALTKVGTGTLTLAGANTYSGDTNVQAGTLRLGSAHALSPHTTLHVAPGATFDPAGYTPTFAALSGTGTVDTGSGGLGVAPAGTNTFSGTLSGSGGLTMSGTGTLELAAANTFSGATTIGSGTVKLAAAGALPGGTRVSLASGATLNLNGHAATVGKLEGAGNVALGSATLAVAQADNSTFSGSISGTGGLAKSGAGTLALSGTHSFTGPTAITAGRLVLNGSAAASAFTVSGGTFAGNATVGPLTVAAGGTLSPGNSPGTVNAGDTAFAGGGSYTWEINHATGVAGTHYDLLSITGTLDVAATSANRFTVNLVSLLPDNSPGTVVNFSPTQNYSYTLATATGGILGFAASDFTVNTANFTNSLAGGTWSVAQAGNTLTLNFTASAIPEPSTYAALAGLGALALAAHRRRRRSQAAGGQR